ncbi:outer membrane beta-barrel protein [Chryseobacterium daeguense]|uniref:outer membrane beta-barrel protein n=1 Tax=Chryseobacterium daeguense TaxID=412438 RepID=UPI0003FF6D0E|nr:outer membrane beta-barrel protein [Chryseobacterium daeguense]
MNNEWLNDLRRKMEDHTEDVPDGLWKNIRDELFADDEAKLVPGFMSNDLKAQDKAVKKFNFTPLYRICGVAAAIAMFFILGRLFDFNDKKPSSQPKISFNQIQSDSQKTILSQKQPDLSVESFKDRNGLNSINSNKSKNTDYNFKKNILGNILNKTQNQINNRWENKILQNPDKIENILSQENQNLAQEQNKNLETQKTAEEPETHELLTKEEREWKEKFEDAEKKKLAKNKKKWMLGVGTGNASSNSSEQFPGYATLNGTTLSLPEIWTSGYGEDPLMSILIANQNKKVDATIKHKTPITFGASALYNINKKWGIGLGVNYTRLSADLTTGSNDNFISSEQNIHYVGIPVQVNYNVIQKGAFTGYVTGGTVIEKAVSGDIKTKYIVDGIVKEETMEEITEKPVQVSVNTALGLQLKVIKNIGIYAEPGVGYHFNDNSSLKTIYKEKPLNFNLKFGIRLLLD